MIKMIVSDMDGTFLNNASDYDRPLFAKLKKIMDDKGILFVPCTGKQCERVEILFKDHLEDLWIVGDSATRIKRNGEVIYEEDLPQEVSGSLLDILISSQKQFDNVISLIACTSHLAYVLDSSPEENLPIVRDSYENVKIIKSFSEIQEPFIKITAFDPKGRTPLLKENLSSLEEKAYIVATDLNWLDISKTGVHKGTTIHNLQKKLGISKEETMVFGDGLNDVDLMKQAVFSFAMRNASEPTKAAANFITRSNEEQGVLWTIEKFLSLEDR